MSKVSPHPWKWECDRDPYSNDCGRIVDANGKVVCDFGKATQYYPGQGIEPSDEDLQVILKAPELEARVAALTADRDRYREELENIAHTDQSTWDEDMRDPIEFKHWAQSRARHALEKGAEG